MDWAKWPNYIHKVLGGSQISTYALVGTGSAASYTNDPRTLTWSDGTPVASGSDTAGVSITGIGNGFRITVPADTTARTLKVYVGGSTSGGKLVAHLSDGSAPDYIDTAFSGTGQYDAVYTLTYQAASIGQQLVVSWTQASGTGNVTLQGAALAPAPPGPSIPTGVSASDGTSSHKRDGDVDRFHQCHELYRVSLDHGGSARHFGWDNQHHQPDRCVGHARNLVLLLRCGHWRRREERTKRAGQWLRRRAATPATDRRIG